MVVESSEIKEYPEKDIENAAAEFKKMIEGYAKQAGVELEEFVETQQMTMEQLEESAKQYAEAKVKQILIVQAILDAEGLSLDDDESLKIQDELIEGSGAGDLAGLIDTYGQAAVDEAIGLLRVENFIVENAEINEKVTSGDTTGANADSTSDESVQTPDEENVVDQELEDEFEDEADNDTVEVTEGSEQ